MTSDKPTHARNVPTAVPPGMSRGQLARDEIARRAAELWRGRGQPSGQDEAIWLEAETQLQAEAQSQPVTGTESQPVPDAPATPLRSRTRVQDPADSAAQLASGRDRDASRAPTHRLRDQ